SCRLPLKRWRGQASGESPVAWRPHAAVEEPDRRRGAVRGRWLASLWVETGPSWLCAAARAAICALSAGSVTSPRAISTSPTPSGPSAAGILSADLARTRIRCPAFASAATAWQPTYPVPPVTRTSNSMYLQTSAGDAAETVLFGRADRRQQDQPVAFERGPPGR